MRQKKGDLPLTERSGIYYRACQPGWADPIDTAYAKAAGGRWNPPGEFGALYLNATIVVAAANVRHAHAGRAIKLFDLRPDRRPELVTVRVPLTRVLDVVTSVAVRMLGLPASYPHGVGRGRCQAIGRRAYAGGIPGVACRSNAECTRAAWIGEELALFDNHPLPRFGRRRSFSEWYPDPIPD